MMYYPPYQRPELPVKCSCSTCNTVPMMELVIEPVLVIDIDANMTYIGVAGTYLIQPAYHYWQLPQHIIVAIYI